MKPIPLIPALQKTFSRPRAFVEAGLVALAIFALFVLVPVWTTPGNDVWFQLKLMKPSTYILMSCLALLNGVLIEMQWHLARERRADSVAAEATTGIGIAIPSILATVSCASCYSSLLALFGLGGSVFIVTNRWWFAALALAITAFALVHTSRRVMGLCTSCQVRPLPKKSGFRLW